MILKPGTALLIIREQRRLLLLLCSLVAEQRSLVLRRVAYSDGVGEQIGDRQDLDFGEVATARVRLETLFHSLLTHRLRHITQADEKAQRGLFARHDMAEVAYQADLHFAALHLYCGALRRVNRLALLLWPQRGSAARGPAVNGRSGGRRRQPPCGRDEIRTEVGTLRPFLPTGRGDHFPHGGVFDPGCRTERGGLGWGRH